MLRALGSEPVEVEAVDALPVDADEVQWQDPAEWQPVTWKQWADFMQKSRAMQVSPPSSKFRSWPSLTPSTPPPFSSDLLLAPLAGQE